MIPGTYGLPLRSAVIARRRRRLRLFATLSALCLIGFVAAVAREMWPHRAEVIAGVSSVFTSPTPAVETTGAAPEPARPVYRHSIVPGGAYSRAEVADAIKKDAVVAAHYQDIDVDKVHATTAGVARAVYVSYRVGNQVYWTKNRVRLAPGETVLTDGDTEIRARCGNLVSEHPQHPVAAEEPPLAALDEPETGLSTMAGDRGPEGTFAHLPLLGGPHGSSSMAFEGLDPAAGPPSLDAPMWFGGGGGGMAPYLRSSTGTGGTSLVAPLGNGGGPNGGGPNGGGSNGGGPNGGGSNGGGPGGGGGEQPPLFVPPTIDETPFTTTGSTETSTAGDEIDETADGEIPTVPEPGTLVLLGLGACGLAARALRARRR